MLSSSDLELDKKSYEEERETITLQSGLTSTLFIKV